MEWGSKASKRSEWKGRKTGQKINLYPYTVKGWFVCVSVFWKILNNFWTDGPIQAKFSGVVWLVPGSHWVGSTWAQSPPAGTGHAYSPFPVAISATVSWHTILESIWRGKQTSVSGFLILDLDPQLVILQLATKNVWWSWWYWEKGRGLEVGNIKGNILKPFFFIFIRL